MTRPTDAEAALARVWRDACPGDGHRDIPASCAMIALRAAAAIGRRAGLEEAASMAKEAARTWKEEWMSPLREEALYDFSDELRALARSGGR